MNDASLSGTLPPVGGGGGGGGVSRCMEVGWKIDRYRDRQYGVR